MKLNGVDISYPMIKKSKGNARVLNSDAISLPYKPDSFDLVVSCSSFHHWRNIKDVLREIIRVLKPGGTFYLTDWCGNFLTSRILDVYFKMTNKAHNNVYTTKECKELLQTVGFKDIVSDVYKINWLWGLMTVSGTKRVRNGKNVH